MKAALEAVADRDEATTKMEPLLIGESSRHRGHLTDLAFELAQKSAGFRRSLPESLVISLAGLVRSMNCYYSNLIEGHNTHPVDIERALKGDYSTDAEKRDLQLEAKAHIEVQRWIDEGGLHAHPNSVEAILEIHRRFCTMLPADLLWVEDPVTKDRVQVGAGELRRRDVMVGKHVSVSPGAVPRFLNRFEQVYGKLGKTETVIAAAAAHQRLLWIHPFLDGNGRVARLMSHATLLDTLETGAIWSIARGLARSVDAYKAHLAACDLRRRNDLDGRGELSEENLAQFTEFFLTTCLDQVAFMEGLMQPERLRTRILFWSEQERRLGSLEDNSGALLEALLYRGEVPRADVPGITGVGDRQARRIVSALAEQGVVISNSPRAPLTLSFPASLASRWMPGLFPERAG
jgi:Fic family protein